MTWGSPVENGKLTRILQGDGAIAFTQDVSLDIDGM
jgi:hypothetical protein